MDPQAKISNIPGEKECLMLLREYGTPERVISHCRAVEKVACRMGKALWEKGYTLDLPLLKAAALLHDIARTVKHHESAGAKYLDSIGFRRIGELVAVHMELPAFDRTHITEKTLLYLADKLVSEDAEVTLEERFARSLQKADDPKVREIIEGRYWEAKKVCELVQGAFKSSEKE